MKNPADKAGFFSLIDLCFGRHLSLSTTLKVSGRAWSLS